MNSKHTPGPWVVKYDGDSVWATKHNDPIAHICTSVAREGGSGLDEKAANARLIAAAPEMAEVLRRICFGSKGDRLDATRDASAILAKYGETE